MLAEGEHSSPNIWRSIRMRGFRRWAPIGGTVTENIAILNYLADRFGAEGSVPRGDAL